MTEEDFEVHESGTYKLLNKREQRERQAYTEGYRDAMRCFAHWGNGVQYVGTSGRTLKEAEAEMATHFNFGAGLETLHEQWDREDDDADSD